MTKDKLDQLQEQMRQVPFGNSVYQITRFNKKETPERNYRHLLLQLSQKLKALKECEFRRRRFDIDLAEINEKLSSATGFEKERLLIDQEEKEYQLESEKKLIEDALVEIVTFEKALSVFPAFTREQFEQAEHGYWRQRLLNDAKRECLATGTISVGTLSSLEATGLIIGKNEKGQITYTEVEEDDLLLESIPDRKGE